MPGVPYNRVGVISNALILIGKPKITSVEQGGPVAQDINQVYDMLLAAELSNPDWRFATDVVQLSQVAGADPNYKGYSAAYQKPSGCLAIWQIWPQIPYEVYGQRIWTYSGNQTIQCEFRKLTEESKMPADFITYFTYVIAYNMGIGITENEHILTRLEAQMNTRRAIAMAVNSQERPNKAISSSPWIQNRGNGFYPGSGIIGN